MGRAGRPSGSAWINSLRPPLYERSVADFRRVGSQRRQFGCDESRCHSFCRIVYMPSAVESRRHLDTERRVERIPRAAAAAGLLVRILRLWLAAKGAGNQRFAAE